MLAPYEGVIAAKTGHVSVHEAGAIEYSGHKVIELEEKDGKLAAEDIKKCIEDFYSDDNHEHMVYPNGLYLISYRIWNIVFETGTNRDLKYLQEL